MDCLAVLRATHGTIKSVVRCLSVCFGTPCAVRKIPDQRLILFVCSAGSISWLMMTDPLVPHARSDPRSNGPCGPYGLNTSSRNMINSIACEIRNARAVYVWPSRCDRLTLNTLARSACYEQCKGSLMQDCFSRQCENPMAEFECVFLMYCWDAAVGPSIKYAVCVGIICAYCARLKYVFPQPRTPWSNAAVSTWIERRLIKRYNVFCLNQRKHIFCTVCD